MKRSPRDLLLVELDGVLYRLRRRNGERPESLDGLGGNKWLITDFGGEPPRLMTVDAPPKYAELLLFRRLREQGELDEQGRILSHWKRKKGQNGAELFFTAVNGNSYVSYADRAQEDSHHHLIFPLHTLLYTALRHYGDERPTAVLFEHGRHVDLLLGRGDKVLETARVSSYSSDEEARQGLTDSVRSELQSMAATTRSEIAQVVYFNWLVTRDEGTVAPSGFGGSTSHKSGQTTTGWGGTGTGEAQAMEKRIGAEWVRSLARSLEAECRVLRVERVELDEGETLLSSAPAVIRRLDAEASCVPAAAKLFYRAHRLAPTAALTLWLLVALFFAAGSWFHSDAASMREEATLLLSEARGAAAGEKIARVDPAQPAALALAAELERLRSLASYQEIFADVTTANADGRLELERVRLEYPERGNPLVTLEGMIPTPFEQANFQHKAFLTALAGLGYQTLESDFTTDVQTLRFRLKLERSGR